MKQSMEKGFRLSLPSMALPIDWYIRRERQRTCSTIGKWNNHVCLSKVKLTSKRWFGLDQKHLAGYRILHYSSDYPSDQPSTETGRRGCGGLVCSDAETTFSLRSVPHQGWEGQVGKNAGCDVEDGTLSCLRVEVWQGSRWVCLVRRQQGKSS
jgi:hypothetical protein